MKRRAIEGHNLRVAEDSPEAAELRSKRMEARRSMLSGAPPAMTPEAEAKPRKRKQPIVRVPLLVAVILMVIAGGVFAFFQTRADGSDAGVVRRRLIAWELTLDPALKEAQVTPIDQMGLRGIQSAIDLLSDAGKARTSDSHSDNSVQRLAHAYLVRYAALIKLDPPHTGAEVARAMVEGGALAPDKWEEARAAWQKWLTDAQAKGAIK